MGSFELVLFLIAAVLVSTLVSQVSSRISTPLFQIAVGVVIALFISTPVQVSLDPELFLVLFIAPLLFNEAKNIDKLGFWQNKGMILSLAIGLVIATMLAVGFAVPVTAALPLACALALGAALGPTDVVAVSSLSGVAKLSNKQHSILSGESLINDASGLVAFQFAIGLAVTGEFSLAGAATDFAIEFFGGIALGVAIGWLCNRIVGGIKKAGVVSRRFHVLFELALPFAVYMLGDLAAVSGVLTVVACGVVFSPSYKDTGAAASKLNIVSSNVWDVMTFALNGIVFVLLGMMLPSGMMKQLDDVTQINWELIGISLLVAAVVVVCRFVWVLLVERMFGSADEIDKGLLRHAVILSCAGAKGAVTLTIVMTIPYSIAVRDDMIFIASVVILTTLLIANFAVPVLSPAPTDEKDERQKKEYTAYAKVLRQVIERLTEDAEDTDLYVEKLGYQNVISEYTERVEKLNARRGIDDDGFVQLRYEALGWQNEHARELMETGEFSEDVADQVIDANERIMDRIRSKKGSGWTLWRSTRRIRLALRAVLKSVGLSTVPRTDEAAEVKRLRIECHRHVVAKLQNFTFSTEYRTEDVAALLVEYQRGLVDVKATAPSVTQFIKSSDLALSIKAKALSYEQDYIEEAYGDGLIDRQSAAKLRRQVSAMQLDLEGEI